MPTVQQLYELWAGDAEPRNELQRSLGPRVLALRPAPLRSAFRLADARAGRRAPAGGPRWCRDVLSHVDVPRALGEFARVLRPGAAAIVYVTLPTARLERCEADELASSCAPTGFTAADVEEAAHAAGLVHARASDSARSGASR